MTIMKFWTGAKMIPQGRLRFDHDVSIWPWGVNLRNCMGTIGRLIYSIDYTTNEVLYN